MCGKEGAEVKHLVKFWISLFVGQRVPLFIFISNKKLEDISHFSGTTDTPDTTVWGGGFFLNGESVWRRQSAWRGVCIPMALWVGRPHLPVNRMTDNVKTLPSPYSVCGR